MEKEALLTIILQDIKELETLVNTFKGKKIIPDVFIQLSKSKTQGILDEIQLLASIKETQETSLHQESAEKPVATKAPEAVSTTEMLKEKPVAIEPVKEPSEQKTERIADKPQEPECKPAEQATSNYKTMPPKNGNNTTVIGELLGKNKPSFNERLLEKQEPATSKSHPPISDLRRAIGINDRFFFQRELFGGNTDLFNQTIDQLNNLNNIDTALAFISTNFNWNTDNEAVTSFVALLRRRFVKQ